MPTTDHKEILPTTCLQKRPRWSETTTVGHPGFKACMTSREREGERVGGQAELWPSSLPFVKNTFGDRRGSQKVAEKSEADKDMNY